MKIGFVGLGQMGTGIARNLMRAGHELTVYNRTRKKTDALAKEGATVGEKPADVAREAEAVLSMLADDSAVEDAVFGSDGIAQTLTKGAVHIGCSTISTRLARKLEQEHADREQEYLSAPVFGRPEAAEAKKLLVILGGDQKTAERFGSVFDAIGRRTIVAGAEPWQANALKLCGNFMIASVLESFGEAFAVVRKAGMDPHVFLEAMTELFGSPVYKNYGTAVAERKFEPAGFALKLGLKDVQLALDTAQEVNAPLPFASILRDHFISAIANGQEQLDWSSVAMVAERNAGLKILS